jgi:hypothetical protein
LPVKFNLSKLAARARGDIRLPLGCRRPAAILPWGRLAGVAVPVGGGRRESRWCQPEWALKAHKRPLSGLAGVIRHSRARKQLNASS